MRKRNGLPNYALMKNQAAIALLLATKEFLRANDIAESIVCSTDSTQRRNVTRPRLSLYRKYLRAYENMGALMATWFSNPEFLDEMGNPVPLTSRSGTNSIAHLIRRSGVPIPIYLALEFLRRSPSVKLRPNGMVEALRKVFVLPEFEIPRAALFVERYLDTLSRNALGRKQGTTLLLERSCHVSDINLDSMAPVLRDIKEGGSAFMDATDGEIEALRLKRRKAGRTAEIGVVVFAWTGRHKSISPPRKSGIRAKARAARG